MMRSAARIFLAVFLSMGAAVSATLQPALAQSAGKALTVDEMKGCLCMEQELDGRRADVATRRAMLDERNAQLTALSAQIKARRAGLNQEDTIGQQMLKSLLTQETALRDLIQSDTRPAVNQSVGEYNALLGIYQTQCLSRPRFKFDADIAAKDLVCPMP